MYFAVGKWKFAMCKPQNWILSFFFLFWSLLFPLFIAFPKCELLFNPIKYLWKYEITYAQWWFQLDIVSTWFNIKKNDILFYFYKTNKSFYISIKNMIFLSTFCSCCYSFSKNLWITAINIIIFCSYFSITTRFESRTNSFNLQLDIFEDFEIAHLALLNLINKYQTKIILRPKNDSIIQFKKVNQ